MDGKFDEKEKLATQQFQRVINGISDGRKVDGAVDGVISRDGFAWGWLNAYNAPHWMDLGAQMRNGSLPGWKNTQDGVGTAVEYYGTSWTRDLMRAKSFALADFRLPGTASRFNGAVDANFGISLTSHQTHGAGMNFDLGIRYSYLTGVFLTSAAVAGPGACD